MSLLKKIVEHFHLKMNSMASQKDIIPFLNRNMNGYGRLSVKIADPKIADYLNGRSQKWPMNHWALLK